MQGVVLIILSLIFLMSLFSPDSYPTKHRLDNTMFEFIVDLYDSHDSWDAYVSGV